MNSFMTKLKAQLLLLGSNPIVAWLVRQVTTCGSAYLISTPFTPAGWQTWALNGAVFIVSGVVHAFDIWLQQQTANAPTPVVPAATPGTVTVSHMSMLKARLKMTLLLIGVVSLLTSTSFAGSSWSVNGKPFGLHAGTMASFGGGNSEGDLVLLPVSAIGLGVGPGVSAYGLTGGYDIVLTNVMNPGTGSASLSPIVGVGVACFVDFAPWINSGLTQQVQGKLGINILGPDLNMLGATLGDVVPSLNCVWDLNTGVQTTTVNLTSAFTGSFLDSLVTKIARIF